MKKTRYTEENIKEVFGFIAQNCRELGWKEEDDGEFLTYVEAGGIGSKIAKSKLAGETSHFTRFFECVEEIVRNSDEHVRGVIAYGLFESIQNVGGKEIDYHRSFDRWLGTESLKLWREVIDYWEGKEWRETEESRKILSKKEVKKR